MLKPLPIGIQDIEKLIEGNYLYIDKTRYLYSLIHSSGYYFLSRPRRFGKSLLISTLEAIFSGKKELFKDLWIDKSEYDWQSYPVIRIDFSTIYNQDHDIFEDEIKRRLIEIGSDYNIELNLDIPQSSMFRDLIIALSKKTEKKVVILIDEYDKPIIDNITDLGTAFKNRESLKSFYGIMKGTDKFLRFVLLTGVTKFSRVSVFSDLNNLFDITISDQYASILGCTHKELSQYFFKYIKQLAEKEGEDCKSIKDKIMLWYNGYRFSDSNSTVYNPFSLLLLFSSLRFKNYWFETGTPSFLINLIKEKDYDIKKIEEVDVSGLAFSSFELDNIKIMPLLFQTGYLTIKDYNNKTRQYKLYYPNFEVEDSFLSYIAESYCKVDAQEVSSYLLKCIDNLKQNNLEAFFETLKIFFADIDYDLHIKQEKYYQTIFYVVFKLIGLKIKAEVSTNIGRIDTVIEIEDKIYLFEFKLNGTAQDALIQIENNKYYEKYKGNDKQIVCVGVEFDYKNRNIGNWQHLIKVI